MQYSSKLWLYYLYIILLLLILLLYYIIIIFITSIIINCIILVRIETGFKPWPLDSKALHLPTK